MTSETTGKNGTENLERIRSELRKLFKTRILSGVQGTEGKEVIPGAPIDVATLATIHNYGTSDGRIPARPFMEPGFQNALKKSQGLAAKALTEIYDGGTGIDSLRLIAVLNQSEIQKSIRALRSDPSAALSPATIANRGRKNRGSGNPIRNKRARGPSRETANKGNLRKNKPRIRVSSEEADVSPLIDTKRLIDSITSIVEQGGSERSFSGGGG